MKILVDFTPRLLAIFFVLVDSRNRTRDRMRLSMTFVLKCYRLHHALPYHLFLLNTNIYLKRGKADFYEMLGVKVGPGLRPEVLFPSGVVEHPHFIEEHSSAVCRSVIAVKEPQREARMLNAASSALCCGLEGFT